MLNMNEEIRDGFLVDISRKKLWSIEMEMLNNLNSICEKHNIDWFLIGGSAIGAVRHKGFIPWDDDIDLGMKREDFERFIRDASQELSPRFVLQYGLNEDCTEFHYFCRIRDTLSTGIIRQEFRNPVGNKGVFIEIYPFDFVSDRKWIRTVQWKMSMAIIELIRNKVYQTSIGNMAKMIKGLLPSDPKKLHTKWMKICTRYNNREHRLVDTVSIPGYSASEVDLFYYQDISVTVKVPFEDTYVRIPVGNDRCLRKTYGDYMQLPPLSERGTHHQTEVFYDPFLPYTKYDGSEIVKEFFSM